MRRQSGFTLIELVIVIVVLGILAALAVPRFISLQREARIAVIDSLFNSIRSGSNIIYAKSAAIGESDNATDSVDIDGTGPGGAIGTNFGYPQAEQADLPERLQQWHHWTPLRGQPPGTMPGPARTAPAPKRRR